MLRKFMTTVALGSLFVGGLAATHLAYAQPEAVGGPQGRGGWMQKADTNGDGKISRAEMTASLEARFAKMDADRDGQLTQKDFDLKRQQRLEKRFADMDTDRNGQISKAEFMAAHQARADKRAGMGGPGGHKWRGGPRGGRGMGAEMRDIRNGGVVTKADFIAKGMARFDRLDTNKDGFVTADEMKAARQMMRGQGRGQWRGPAGDRGMPPPPPEQN